MTTASDLALLRRFEPVVRYTRGEQFFPMDVATYVKVASLWVKRPQAGQAACLLPRDEVTLERLAHPRPEKFGSVSFLKFANPLSAAELASYRLRESFAPQEPHEVFHAGRGRLARVGYISRFSNAIFQLSLLARGRVPGDAAAAAAITYKALLLADEQYRYCGRVVRENGWVVLQYWFLYAFNNWRTGFYGLNDHEADWEMICIYLSETPEGQVNPEWVAYASHDFSGDDLRRRWDDPELEKVGQHPVVYAAAGSHASYFTAGEYLVELDIPFLLPLTRIAARIQRFWREKLRQYYDDGEEDEETPPALPAELGIFQMPFVDYARGDGLSIGPGQHQSWSQPYLISEPPAWVSQYRGLWGRHVPDPLAGENAPAGPMYNRNGTVRRVWYDPVGWAGLDKIPPSAQALERVREQHANLTARQAELTQIIDTKSHCLTGLGLETAAVQHQPHLKKFYEHRQEEIKQLSAELDDLRAEYAENEALLEALSLYRRRLERGDRPPARDHIHRARQPIPESDLQIGRLMETWAAVSTGLMLVSLVGVILFAPHIWFMGLIAVITLFVVIEATFRRWLTQLITRITIALAAVAAILLFFDFFPQITLLSALVAGGYMLWENVRELLD